MRSLFAAELFVFKATPFSTAAILLEEHGGRLSLEHWRGLELLQVFRQNGHAKFGFSLRTLIGTFRVKAMSHGPDRCGPTSSACCHRSLNT
jgi:hypothetical protein